MAWRAIAASIQHELRQAGAVPPTETAFLALIVHALKDGLLIQRLLTPDEIPGPFVVDAVALLLRTWAAFGRPVEGSAEMS